MPSPVHAFEVVQATRADRQMVEAFGRLIPQLSSSAPRPTPEAVRQLLESPNTTVFLAREGGQLIVGMLALVVFRIPTGMRAWIEDVVVDERARGQGAGEVLVRTAVGRARELGARTVELTSRTSRTAANRLYLRLGFLRRETNVYRYVIDG